MEKVQSFSFWEKQWLKKADTVIIGSGIVGLQCAIHIKKQNPHKEVWVIDRAPVSLGASLRNAGFACFGSMGEILDDITRTDETTALALYEKRFKGLKLLLKDFGETKIGYEKTGGYEIFSPDAQAELDSISNQIDAINELLRPITIDKPFLTKSTAGLNMNVHATGIFTPLEGALQTHLLYQAIWDTAIVAGVKIYGGLSALTPTLLDSKQWQIQTKEGYTIGARRVVICTNGFAKSLLPELEVEPARGQVLVTSAIPTLPWRGLMHADKGYIYFRSLGTRILIGGARNANFESENTTELNTTEPITHELIQFLKTVVIPSVDFEITDQWAGIMGMHTNRTPIVKMVEPGLFVCVRMGGMGVALSALVSRELGELVKNHS